MEWVRAGEGQEGLFPIGAHLQLLEPCSFGKGEFKELKALCFSFFIKQGLRKVTRQ